MKHHKIPGEFDVHPYLRLGWRGPTNKTTLDFGKYLTGELPTVPASVDDMSRVTTFNGMLNRKYGVCGPTAVFNFIAMAYKYLYDQDVTVTDDNLIDFYRRSGNPNFRIEPDGSAVGDNGVDNAVMLAELQNGGGMTISHSDGSTELVKAVCYGKLSGNSGDGFTNQIRAATALFGGVLLSVFLEVAQQSQTVASPPVWVDVPSSGDWGGHDIFGGAYVAGNDPTAADEYVMSWLIKVGVSDGFINSRGRECFAIILPIMMKNKPMLAGVDWQELAGDFETLTGRPFPVPIPND